MDFNLTREVMWNFFEASVIFLSLVVLRRTIKQTNAYRHLILMFLTMVVYFVRYILLTIALLFLSVPLYTFSYMLLAIQLVLLIAAADSLYRDTLDLAQTSIFIGLATMAIVVTILTPDAVFITTLPDGTQSIIPNLEISLLSLPGFLLGCSIYLGILMKVHWEAPNSLKKYSRIMVIGALLFITSPLLLDVTGLWLIFPGSVQLMAGIGILVWMYPITKQPKLVFILSFKVLRLSVIDTDTGIPLFTHTWKAGQNIVDDDIFSGMFHGVRGILKATINRGNVKEIDLENALIIIQRTPQRNISSVLVTTRPSQTLRDALQLFTQKFFEQFKPYFGKTMLTSQFEAASDLIAEYFPFLPEFE